MSNKAISTGTLSLRFMQNALRSKQLQQVELDRAEVKDEGKWEIGQDVRKVWGIGQENQQHDAVVYESSYLPFLFSPEHEESETSKPLGRRVFDKKGHDVSKHPPLQQAHEDTEIPDEDTAAMPTTSLPLNTEENLTKGRRLKVHAKPISISSLSVGKKLKGFDTFDKPENGMEDKEIQRQKSIAGLKRKTAKQAIFDMSGVGTDLRSMRKSKRNVNDSDGDLASSDEDGLKLKHRQEKIHQRPVPSGFMKPAGVDEPTSHSNPSSSIAKAKPPSSPIPDVIEGTRKRTRSQDDQGNDEKGKRKKKKKKVAAE